MKLFRLSRLGVLLAGAAFAQSGGVSALQSQASEKSEQQLRLTLSDEVKRVKPDVSDAVLTRNSEFYLKALPEVRKSFDGKSCGTSPCSPALINRAILDTYLLTLQRKDYGVISFGDVGQTVTDTGYLYVWSDPPQADFKLLLGAVTAWAEKTNKEKFILKSDYKLHIEMPGYEPFDAPCSNKENGGALCGAKLKKN